MFLFLPCSFRVGVLVTGLKVGIYWEMIKISKRGGEDKKTGIKYQGGRGVFFLFYQSKLLSHFVPVFPDTKLKQRFLG